MQRKKDTRELILSQTYQLLFVYNWEAITIEQIESSIGRTRGAIFYFFKNKNELFNSIINERFLSKFLTTEVNTSERRGRHPKQATGVGALRQARRVREHGTDRI